MFPNDGKEVKLDPFFQKQHNNWDTQEELSAFLLFDPRHSNNFCACTLTAGERRALHLVHSFREDSPRFYLQFAAFLNPVMARHNTIFRNGKQSLETYIYQQGGKLWIVYCILFFGESPQKLSVTIFACVGSTEINCGRSQT